MKDYEKVEFHPPQNAAVPEGEGAQEFDLVCTFRRKPDGRVCMTQFGDAPMPGYGKEKMNEAKPDYGGYVGSMRQQGYPNA
jgi:hypothetical protein